MILTLFLALAAPTQASDELAAADRAVEQCIASVGPDRLTCIRRPFAECEAATPMSQLDINHCSALALAAWRRGLDRQTENLLRRIDAAQRIRIGQLQQGWRRWMERDCQLRAPPVDASIRPFSLTMCRAEHVAIRAIQLSGWENAPQN